MNKRILFLSLAVLMMMAPGCKKSNDEPYKEEETEETPIAVKSVTIQGAPTEAMYVGDRVTLTVQITPADATNQKVTWNTTNEKVATVDTAGEVLAYGVGECEISATVDGVTAKVPITVISRSESRNACSDQMGHVGASKTDNGRNNQSVTGKFGESGWHYEMWYSDGNNSVTYYDNGTFKASWSGTNEYDLYVGIRSGSVNKNKQYDAYYKYEKTGSAMYGNMGILGWTEDPLTEFRIIVDWYGSEGYQSWKKLGDLEIDDAVYDIYARVADQQPSISGLDTFLRIHAVRQSSRQCGHIDISAHINKWDELCHGQEETLPSTNGSNVSYTLALGKLYEVKFMVEVGAGTGSLDCTYFYMSDGQE